MSNKSHFFRQSINLPFIMTVQVTAPNQVISLGHETTGTYSGTIDWGDGVSTQNNKANFQHTYLAIGIYDIKIYGTIYRWKQNNNSSILDISQWGSNFSFGDSSSAFQQMTNLNITATDTPDTSEMTNMYRMFYKSSNVVGNAGFDTWDTSSATEMGGMFAQATNFNGVISNWNTSLVASFRGMFQSSTTFNHPLNNWDTSSVTDMAFMFDRAFSFNQPLNNWDTSNVTTMTYMFRSIFGIVPFNQDISSWDFSGLNSSTSLVQFMKGKSQANYDSAYYDNLLIKWASDPSLGGLQPNIIGTIDMGTIKYTANGASARASILANNKAVTINDGGQI